MIPQGPSQVLWYLGAGGVLHLPSLIVQLTGGNQEGKTFAPAAGNASSASRTSSKSVTESREIVRLPGLKLGDYRKMTRVRRIVVSRPESRERLVLSAGCCPKAAEFPPLKRNTLNALSLTHSQTHIFHRPNFCGMPFLPFSAPANWISHFNAFACRLARAPPP